MCDVDAHSANCGIRNQFTRYNILNSCSFIECVINLNADRTDRISKQRKIDLDDQ